MRPSMTIGISGGSGSGKTTLARRLAEHFDGRITLLRHDDYYRPHSSLSAAERARLNYDHPEAFDTPLLLQQLRELRQGHAVDAPLYDYRTHDRSRQTRHLTPTPVILVEGILILADPALRELLDIKIFVDTDADVRILRRIRRDVHRRGRSLESVIEQYLTTVKPMHEAFVEPSKKHADLIIPEGGRNPVAYRMLVEQIEQHLTAPAAGTGSCE